MIEAKNKPTPKKMDTKEFELPDTLFVRDIENKVFQGIVLQCLSEIEGISLLEGNFIDNILGRKGSESVKGITSEQDNKNHSVSIRVEVNIYFGHSIPEMAERIQSRIAEEVTRLTGLHVACVHVVFKNVVPLETQKKQQTPPPNPAQAILDEEYNDTF
jgi:uncharacterized alkaline shock family protein YloU